MSQQLLYLVMTGLSATSDTMTATTNNLANNSTTAFKAQQPVFHALPLYGQGLPDRVDTTATEDSSNLTQGPIQQTGRSLDVALQGKGWIAVQAKDGTPAYTRNGALSISATGVLETSDGHPVIGQNGQPISLPPLQSVTIGDDGTISGVPQGQGASEIATLNQIMLSNPPSTSMRRRTDGLFQSTTNPTPQADGKMRLQVGALEGSNTDAVGLMVNMIENTRMFQTQTDLMHTVSNLTEGESPLTIT